MDQKIGSLQYLKGDATQPVGEGHKILVHICNDIGGWGKGFVLALSNRWDKPETAYRNWFISQKDFKLGNVQYVKVETQLIVANIIGQHDIVWKNNHPPIRYDAVRKGLGKVANKAKELDASIHMPRIGSGLAGGNWQEIEKIIVETINSEGINVIVYDFEV